MLDHKKQVSAYWLLMQVAIRARHDFARLAEKKYQLTWAQMHTLCLIEPEHPMAMNLISCQLGCDASNVTGIIDRLEAQGYMLRRDNPFDRRIKTIVLTNEGTMLRTRILNDITQAGITYVQNLTTKEHQQLYSLLVKALSTPTKSCNINV